jgi:hypothetical protein
MLKPDEYPAEIFRILVDAVVERADVLAVEKAQNTLFQLSAAFAGNDLQHIDTFLRSFADGAFQLDIDQIALVEQRVKVQLHL